MLGGSATMDDRRWTMPDTLDNLLAHLVTRPEAGECQGWAIRPVQGGMNNLVYRATRGDDDLAIKFMRRDERDRAGREYAVLSALVSLGLDLAPRPVLLERERYALPVVVESWVAGNVLPEPPADDAAWGELIQHYAAIHQVTPSRCTAPIGAAVTNMASVAQGRAMIAEQIARLPTEGRPSNLEELARRIEQTRWPDMPESPTALCRVDANTLNFIRRPGGWASVDWENSGWGDPAFEIVDMMTHPVYFSVPASRWEWVINTYTAYTSDHTAPERIQAYYPLMLAWWVARTARLIYELPRGIDARLGGTPSFLHNLDDQYQHYVELTDGALAT
jgi:aminoglycoside phosphotransferase (APT) family kinase protein